MMSFIALDTILKQRSLTDSQRLRGARQYTSRVHVADICEALRASIRKPSSGRIYNIVDDDPASRAEVFAFAHTLIEKKWPGQIKTRNYSDMLGSSSQAQVLPGQKRVSNALLKNELGVQLFHPTYRSGLESIIKSMENPFH
ncbi:hypothetical protein IFM89_006087 [Coptis chinensis]|uniref:Uncharacterized protein n=1 Tax=Coptis chinensis TaxID=261450 RepID=A0A835H354_9MAGN|nr:hypothetical protein IFM89_006087 [Coptis chinensis]